MARGLQIERLRPAKSRIKIWLMAAVLFVAEMMRAGFAQEAASASLNRAPSHHGGPASFAVGVAGRSQAHQQHAFRNPALAPVQRNAIGMPVAPPEATPESAVGKFGLRPPQFHGAAVPSSAATDLAHPHAALGAPAIPRLGSGPTPTVLNRGAIDGSGLIRRGSAPSALGGPAKSISGINGSTFRSKR